MSCNDCSNSFVKVEFDPNGGPGNNVVSTDGDLELSNENRTAIALAPDPLVALTFTLPANPRVGQSHRLVAAGASITVDGGDNTVSTVVVGTTVALGSARVYTFTKTDFCDPCAPGTWVPDCCEAVVPG